MTDIAITLVVCASSLGALWIVRDGALRWQQQNVTAVFEKRLADVEKRCERMGDRLAERVIAGGKR